MTPTELGIPKPDPRDDEYGQAQIVYQEIERALEYAEPGTERDLVDAILEALIHAGTFARAALVSNSCAARDYRCCETLTDAEHTARYGYAMSRGPGWNG